MTLTRLAAAFALVGSMAAMTAGSAHAESTLSPTPPGTFIDAAGEVRPFRDSYSNWLAMNARRPRYLRALVEAGILTGLGTAYYWVDPLANSADWDYPSFGDKLRFESVRFDNNLFATNHVLHPLAGAALYGFSRVNGLGVGTSFGYAALSSVFWEYVLEFREQASINDMVFTPFGGVAIGEFLFQLGNYLNSAPGGGGFAQRLAAATLGAPQNVHDALDGVRAPREPPRDSLGLSSAYAHRFVLAYEGGFIGTGAHRARAIHGFAVEAELAAMPGLRRPGSFSKLFADGNFVSFASRAGWGAEGLSVVDLHVAADLAGMYQQDFQTGSGLDSAALFALESAFRLNQREVENHHDRFAIVHLPGPHTSVWLGAGELLTNFDLAMHVDFAAVHPLAYPVWQRENGSTVVKTVLARERYQYTLGFSTRAGFRVSFRNVEAKTSLRYGRYDSIEGLDRAQASVARDLSTNDSILELGASLGVAPEASPLILRANVETLRRRGQMGSFRAVRQERRLGLLGGLAF